MERQDGPFYEIYFTLTRNLTIMNPSKLLNSLHAFLADVIGLGTIRSEVLFLFHLCIMHHIEKCTCCRFSDLNLS